MTRISKELRAVQDAEEALAAAREKLRLARGRRRIACACGRTHALGTLDALIIMHYVEPHGCTGGDYWSQGIWAFVCPVTGNYHRFYFNDFDQDWQERSKIGVAAEPTFKGLYLDVFKSVRDAYPSDLKTIAQGKCNDYIDRNRERFELPPKKVKK